MLELMIRATIVGGLAFGAALLFENGLAHMRLPRRFAWTFALVATLVLPFMPRLFTTSPAAAVPEVNAPLVVLSFSSTVESRFDVDIARVAWLLLSVLALIVFIVSYARLQRERRRWRDVRVAETEVLLSRRFGPAVFGFATPQIVVPEWIESTSQEEQRLIVLHEREHIRAGDQMQLLLSIIATIAMPWNPFVWLQSRRLRFTVEADCDQRVLAQAPDAARYATLLVDVGSKQLSRHSGLLPTSALAEHRNGLERRLTMLAKRLIENRWKAAGLMAIGLMVTAIACESRLPNEPQQPTPRASANPNDVTGTRVKVRDGTVVPERDNVGALIEKHYPPLLREAGIGGHVIVGVNVHVNGDVDGHHIVKSSGHEALDQAALKIVREMYISPYRVREGETPKDQVHQIYLQFDARPRAQRTGLTVPDTAAVLQEPTFTPYTDMPKIANRDELSVLLVRHYPPLLRDAGIGGTALLWVLVDEKGDVLATKVKESSGRRELDQAAEEVARKMKFTPAKNRGAEVKVWIQMPIVFATEKLTWKRPAPDETIESEYPVSLKQAGIGGTVGIRVHVTNDGKADEVIVSRSSGREALDQAAVRVAKRYQWGHEGRGRATSYWTSTSITFDPRVSRQR